MPAETPLVQAYFQVCGELRELPGGQRLAKSGTLHRETAAACDGIGEEGIEARCRVVAFQEP